MPSPPWAASLPGQLDLGCVGELAKFEPEGMNVRAAILLLPAHPLIITDSMRRDTASCDKHVKLYLVLNR